MQTCTQEASGERLCECLQRHCNSSQRHIYKNLLRAGRVYVDGVLEKNGKRRLKANAVVRFDREMEARGQQLVEVRAPTIFVYNKPCGLLTAR